MHVDCGDRNVDPCVQGEDYCPRRIGGVGVQEVGYEEQLILVCEAFGPVVCEAQADFAVDTDGVMAVSKMQWLDVL